ncbi:MAG: hypothetical protein ACREJ3_14000, partial [Polyangiaceae bacterium]
TTAVAAAPLPIPAASPTTHGASGSAHQQSAVANSPGRSLNLGNLGGLARGVSPDDPGSEGPSVPGQCISGGQVQQVIALHQVAIRRACWERNPSTKASVNVSVTLTVAGDGSAHGVSTSGDDPSVAKCIENDVRGWHFPAMGCSQKTGFSFKFVRQ